MNIELSDTKQLLDLTEMCSGSEAGSYLRLIDFLYHSTLGLRVIQLSRARSTRFNIYMYIYMYIYIYIYIISEALSHTV